MASERPSSAEIFPGMQDPQTIDAVISDFYYDDFAVELHVGNEIFKISSSRLALASPVFRQMFTLPQPKIAQPVVLHNDPGEFKDYLWYIHADPFSAQDFLELPDSAAKCSRMLGIANVAHMYDVSNVAARAMKNALGMLLSTERSFDIDLELAHRLLRTPAEVQIDTDGEDMHKQCVDVVCDAMSPRGGSGVFETDPITAVTLAREFDNRTVMAHAYFYVLQKGDDYWKADKRLDALDRMRLLCGSHALFNNHKETYGTIRRIRGGRISATGFSPVRPGISIGVHESIRHVRSRLWEYFDIEPWNLVP
ncbi:hypothetical protein AURDEDRAFT_188753 [Auricularia subglabra TFB-10046 SS5]|uniref:Uncharacterized protein n=1 Tax=Auricularia subglabra (strain TFB-10046 / SS5) TaxID=717982 RepID=J0LER3_AURST|nr:hypothetical protein AURDEDRAFT_188753 [Auricularia subglabra TFB-10046 SS5]